MLFFFFKILLLVKEIVGFVNEQNCDIIDLSWKIDKYSVVLPGHKEFDFYNLISNKYNISEDYWYPAREFCMAEHIATHLDAPYHFNPKGWKVGEIPAERFLGEGATIDVSKEVECYGRNFTLKVKHLQHWVKQYDGFQENTILIIRFGWSQKYYNKNDYLGLDKNKNQDFPGISTEAAQWIVDSGKIVGVGVDTASLDPGNTKTFQSHRILLANQIYGLENLKIPENMPVKNFGIIPMPLKLSRGTGAPARVFAFDFFKK